MNKNLEQQMIGAASYESKKENGGHMIAETYFLKGFKACHNLMLEDMKKLLEALVFYSKAHFYQSGGHAAGPNIEENYIILRDCGYIARQALKDFEEKYGEI
jgi:hypothetical protein